MLSDDQDRIDRQVLAPTAQSLGDGGINLEAEFAGPLAALVAVRFLVHVKRDHLDVRFVPGAGVGIADEKSIANMLRMRKVPVNGSDDGKALGRGVGAAQQKPGGRSTSLKEFPSSQHRLSPLKRRFTSRLIGDCQVWRLVAFLLAI